MTSTTPQVTIDRATLKVLCEGAWHWANELDNHVAEDPKIPVTDRVNYRQEADRIGMAIDRSPVAIFRDDPDTVTVEPTSTLSIDGVKIIVPVSLETDEDDTLRTTLDFSEAYDVLDAWQKANPDQRRFGFTGADDAGPESAYVAWTRNGVLEVVHVNPFYNGVATMNSYAVDELTQLDGIEQA